MLVELSVRNYALLDNVRISFDPRFNTLTGETGAGKSLLAGALGLLLGGKAQSSFIRHGCNEAEVMGVIALNEGSEGHCWLEANDIPFEDDQLILRRILKLNGKNTIYANGVVITVGQLEQLSTFLFDMHGQHEHQSLYDLDKQRLLLDKAANVENLAGEVAQPYQKAKSLRLVLKRQREALAKDVLERDYLAEQLAEIEEVNPTQAERDRLSETLKALEGKERTLNYLNKFRGCMKDQDGILNGMRQALAMLKPISSELGGGLKRFEGVLLELEDCTEELLSLRDALNFSEAELEKMNDRLASIQRLEKKHGGTIESLLKFAEATRIKLEAIDMGEENDKALEEEIVRADQHLRAQAQVLSEKRRKHAKTLEKGVSLALKELQMPDAQFVIDIQDRTNSKGHKTLSPTGMDDINFLFSANKGMALKSLKDVASGGEASRVLLAIKTILASQESVECLIFDEVDTGVGGSAAVAIGVYMQKLSSYKQVICITHLAQIAARSDLQLKIIKETVDEATSTQVIAVAVEDRQYEIARMLAGSTHEAALQHAQVLLAESQRKG